MPPKIKIEKDDILNAAFDIVRFQGFSQLNARTLADHMHCSTKPIYRVYRTMEELKKDIVSKASKFNEDYILSHTNGGNPFLNSGLAYIQFAKDEKHLFQLLFMSEEFNLHSFNQIVESEENNIITSMISNQLSISLEDSKDLFITIWLTTHGIATIFATNSCTLTEKEYEKILMDTMNGLILKYRSK